MPVDGGAAAQGANSRLDLDEAVAAGEEFGPGEQADDADVVHRVADAAEAAGARAGQHAVHGAAGVAAEGFEAGDLGGGGDGGQGEVQADQGEFEAAAEDDRGGVRVGVDVVFGGRGHVAEVHGAAHQHDLVDGGGDVGGEAQGEGEVGERAEHAQGDAGGCCGAQQGDQGGDGVGLGRRLGGRGEVGAVEAVGAADEFGGFQGEDQGGGAAGVDRDFGVAGEFDDAAGVGGGLRDRDVAGDGGDHGHGETVGQSEGEEDGDGVVLAGVGVDDQGLHAGLS